MNFEEAILSHTNWKQRLKEYIQKRPNTLTSEEVCKDDCCALGKWIYRDAKTSIENDELYEELKNQHRKFHLEAGEIVKKVNNGENVDEDIAIGNSSSFNITSSKILLILIRLRAKGPANPINK